MKWFTYFVTNKFSRLTNGHLPSNKLLDKILQHDGREAYAGYFELDYDALKLEYDTGRLDSKGKKIFEYHKEDVKCDLVCNGKTFVQYEGTCRPALNCVAFDFDGPKALEDTNAFVEWLNIPDAVVFFSGSKGFHVLVHFDYFNLPASPELVLKLRDLAKYLKKHFPSMDSGIYDYARKFRVPFTRHDKTELYKTYIHPDILKKYPLEKIKLLASDRNIEDFLPPDMPREPLEKITNALSESSRKSYEVDKKSSGQLLKPSPFESFPGKKCIDRMLKSRCDSVGRNNACMRLVNDFYRTDLSMAVAEEKIRKWAYDCGLPENEWREILSGIYERGENYNFGCQDEIKEKFCTATCKIWTKLAPEKRPKCVDAPKSAALETDNAKKVSQKQIAIRLLEWDFKCKYNEKTDEYFGGLIVRQEKNIFLYEFGHWHEVTDKHISKIRRRIQFHLEGKGTVSQIDNTFKMMVDYLPVTPEGVDMFLPNSNVVNFSNGTLRIKRNDQGKLYKEFTEGHRPTDYLTSKHSLKYSVVVNPLDTCPKFMQVLEDLFSGNSDKEERIKAIAMMYGGSLMPMFSMMFYFYGKAKTGKSTTILILKQLLDEKNLSSVQPKDFHGFNLEAMAGKLVNYVTDVDVRTPINDDVVKQILDRTPITIRRKNRTDIRACIPGMHLFAGNDLLKSFEASTAMARRWLIMEFLNEIDDSESNFSSAEEFSKYIYSSESGGILNFALYGLDLLLESNGRFIQFESSRKSMEDWQEREDTTQQFLNDVTSDGVDMDGVNHKWELSEDGRIPRSYTWKVFNAWQEDSLTHKDKVKKSDFFNRLGGKNHTLKKVRGVMHIVGIGQCIADNASSINADSRI